MDGETVFAKTLRTKEGEGGGEAGLLEVVTATHPNSTAFLQWPRGCESEFTVKVCSDPPGCVGGGGEGEETVHHVSVGGGGGDDGGDFAVLTLDDLEPCRAYSFSVMDSAGQALGGGSLKTDFSESLEFRPEDFVVSVLGDGDVAVGWSDRHDCVPFFAVALLLRGQSVFRTSVAKGHDRRTVRLLLSEHLRHPLEQCAEYELTVAPEVDEASPEWIRANTKTHQVRICKNST